LRYVCLAFPNDDGLRWLTARTAELRAAADSSARDAVASARYTRLLVKLIGVFLRNPWSQFVEETAVERSRPLIEFAAAVLARRHKKVLRTGRRLAQLDLVGLHALRIEIKKLRYAAEFFSALYDKKAVREYLTALAALQELLGGLNDAATVERLMKPLRESGDSRPQTEAPGLVRGWTAAATQARIDQLPQAWDRFRACAIFW